ncbi:AMP-binding protein [Thermus thermamylovorans]|uniref:AMP-dependent synthetase n=1 Tax=Thermus thermamylovorans TaxID=2509362 RepID=A0A4Q9B7R8_9DEIN|nr:AMP-binding protein [Thermus thermamylovorans]TBH21871.1 AMP-dependent synthetase [Thermus thermamylovorans]
MTQTLYWERPWLRFYPPGTPAEAETPTGSVGEKVREAFEGRSREVALLYYGRAYRYEELLEAIQRFAGGLKALGLAPGDRVGLYLANSPQFVIAYLGILWAGGVVVPVSPLYTSHELRHQLLDSGARFLVVQDALLENAARTGVALEATVVASLKEALPTWQRLLVRGLPPPKGPGIHPFADLLRSAPLPVPEPRGEEDLAALPYTGGTTGLPKGVEITHGNILAAHRVIQSLNPLGRENTILAFLPFYHIYGQVVLLLGGLLSGARLVVFSTPDPDWILEAMVRYRATHFFGVPSLYEVLRDHPKAHWVDWRRLEVVVSGADTLHEATVEAFKRRTGREIAEGYGMTETTSVSHINPRDRIKRGSFGIPLPGIRALVVDPETLEPVPVGEVGELALAGPNVTRGYWRREDENARSFFSQGGLRFFRTGDLVRMDEEGYFHFYDRAKDMIKYKGRPVFPREIEEALRAHPLVKAAGVVGVPDPKVGAYPKAYVVLEAEARGKVTEEDLLAFLKERLAPYKLPREIEFRGELPKTDVGKVSRRELREEVQGGPAAG